MADLLESMEIDGHIYSFDINIDQIEVSHPKVSFAPCDSNDLSTFPEKLFSTLPHPWLVIEDAHQNVYELLTFIDKYMQSGDYLLVEDTLDWRKYRKMQKFVRNTSGNYQVDTRYTDMYGYNVTWNINGYLRRK
jgi:cephalosporin hydroxylase